jgi:hypothetical protein
MDVEPPASTMTLYDTSYDSTTSSPLRPLSTGAPARLPTASPLEPLARLPVLTTIAGLTREATGGGGSTHGGPIGRGGAPAWPSFYNPWIGTISMWLGSTMGASLPCPPHPALPTTPPYDIRLTFDNVGSASSTAAGDPYVDTLVLAGWRLGLGPPSSPRSTPWR